MKGMGQRLKKLRKQRGITQQQMSTFLGLSINGYANYEHDDTEPSIEKFIILAQTLDTSVEYIVKGEELSDKFLGEEAFSKRLRELRSNKKMTQVQVAEVLGIKEVSYQQYEYGSFEPKLENLMKLAELFGVTLDELMGRKLKTEG